MKKYLYEREFEYKISVFTKINFYLRVGSFLWEYISVKGFDNTKNNDTVIDVTMPVDDNIYVELYSRKEIQGLLVKGIEKSTSEKREIFVPKMLDYEGVIAAINEAKQIIEERKIQEIEKKKKVEEKRMQILQEKEKLKEKREAFLANEYIAVKEKYPTFFLDEHDEYATFIYIDDKKDLTIKSIDKNMMELVASTIKYSAIHYYEKSGNIHYVSNINVNYDNSSIAASFVPSKIKMTPVVIGTLLFGQMGMTAGALLGYKGGHFENNLDEHKGLNISSSTERIDDRSVILNFYSDKNKQYTDIELPHEIYNFLQTHLAEKKYDIVLANEKHSYISGDRTTISGKQQSMIEMDGVSNNKMSLEEFDIAVKKLKLLVENDLISQDEFNEKKKELMDNIL